MKIKILSYIIIAILAISAVGNINATPLPASNVTLHNVDNVTQVLDVYLIDPYYSPQERFVAHHVIDPGVNITFEINDTRYIFVWHGEYVDSYQWKWRFCDFDKYNNIVVYSDWYFYYSLQYGHYFYHFDPNDIPSYVGV